MKKPVLIAAGIALLGFALLLFLMTRVGKTPPVSPEGVAGPRAGEHGAPAASAVREASPETPATSPETVVAPLAPRAGDAAVSSKIGGKVVAEESGQPLAGATIRASIFHRGAQAGDDPAWTKEAGADAQGRFELSGLAFAPYKLRASAPGRLDREVDGVFPGDVVDLKLPYQEGIPCKVIVDREEGAEPLSRHKVRVAIEMDAWTLDAETDQEGKLLITGIDRGDFEVARNAHRIEVEVPGFADAYLTAVPGETYEITVDPGVTVEGVVLDARTGKPVAGASLHTQAGHEASAGERGTYRITGVDDDLTAYAAGYAPETKELDDHEEGQTLRVDFRLKRGLTLKGKVTDSARKPLAGARVGLAPDLLDLDSSSERLEARLLEILSSVSGADGAYRIEGLPAEALDLPGGIEVAVRPPGAVSAFTLELDVEVDSGEVEHDIVLDLQDALLGSVIEEGGGPVPRAGIVVESIEDDFSTSSGTNDQGKFTLRSLRAGEYRLRVDRDGKVVHLMELSVPTEAVKITLDALEAVRGKVVAEGSLEALVGLAVTLHAAPGSGPPVGSTATTDGEGRFSIEDVPRGDFILLVKPGPREKAYSRFSREHRTPIAVARGGWIGEVGYPVLPSGEIALTFSVAGKDGTAQPAHGPVWVTILSFRPAKDLGAVPARGEALLVEEARAGFHARWREGEYRVRCANTIEGKQILKDEAFTLEAMGTVERAVTFAGGK